MFSYHCTIAWQGGICDSLCCLFYLTVVFFFFLCCMCVCALFSLFNKSLLSGAATMFLMLHFLIFYSPLACYNVYRFVASSLFSCCPIILYVIYAYYSCVDTTEIKDSLTELIALRQTRKIIKAALHLPTIKFTKTFEQKISSPT